MPRLFYALWPDDDTRVALAEAAARIDLRDASLVRPENLHITVRFLGTISDELTDQLRFSQPVQGLGQFTLEINDVGWWRSSQVAWLAPLVVPPQMEEMVFKVQEHLAKWDITQKKGPFTPHVTVARNARRAPRVFGSIAVEWRVDSVALILSKTEPIGAYYEVQNRWSLTG